MQAHPEGTDLSEPSNYRFFIYLALFVLCCLTYSSFLGKSLWLDECISYWVSSSGLKASIGRSWNFQGQSPLYYALLSIWMNLIGSSEIAIRSLSLICLTIALAVVFIWLKRNFSLVAAFSGCIIFVFQDNTLLALSARPYALAIMLSVIAIFELHKNTINQSSTVNLILFSIFSSLSIYAHYFSALGIFASALGLLIFGRLKQKTIRQIVIALLLVLLLCAPLLPQLILLKSKAAEISFAAPFSVSDLPGALIPIFPSAALMIALISCSLWIKKPVQSLFNSKRMPSEDSGRMLLIASTWWILPFLALLSLSILSGSSFLIPRYLSFSSPAFAIFAAILISQIKTDQQRLVLVFTVLLLGLREMNRNWQIEDWRTAVKVATENSSNILMASGLAETNQLSWLENPSTETQQYLVSPAQVYALSEKFEAIPNQIYKEQLRTFMISKIKNHVSLYGKATVISDSKGGFSEKLTSISEELGFVSQIKSSGKIQVMEITPK